MGDKNLLEETIYAIEPLTLEDAEGIGSVDGTLTIEQFKKLADIEYYSGYGGHYIALDLVIVFENCGYTRNEYDGNEYGVEHKAPIKPEKVMEVKVDKFLLIRDDNREDLFHKCGNTYQGELDQDKEEEEYGLAQKKEEKGKIIAKGEKQAKKRDKQNGIER